MDLLNNKILDRFNKYINNKTPLERTAIYKIIFKKKKKRR